MKLHRAFYFPLILGFCFSARVSFGQETSSQPNLVGVKDSLKKWKQDLTKLSGIEHLFPQQSPKLRLDSVMAFYQGNLMEQTSFQDFYPVYSSYYGFGANFYLTELPFTIQYRSNSGFVENYQSLFSGLPKLNFNHSAYLDNIRKQISDKIRPDELLDLARNRYNLIKQKYQDQLENELDLLLSDYSTTYERVIDFSSNQIKIDELDQNLILNKVMPAGWKEKIVFHQKRAEELAKMVSSPERDSLWRESISIIQEDKVRSEITNKVARAQQQFNESPIVQEIKSQIRIPENGLNKALQDPSRLVSAIKENASISGIQKLFLNVTKLNIGSNSIVSNGLDFKQLMNNGIDAEFMSKKISIGGIYGSGNINQQFNAVNGISSYITNEFGKLAGVKVGSGWDSKINQSVSLNLFSFSMLSDRFGIDPFQINQRNIQGPSRKDAVLTYHSAFQLRGQSTVKVDLSKSFGSYDNSLNSDSTSFGKQNTGELFRNNGKQNWAFGIAYSGKIKSINVNSGLQHTGLGYNNPGNFAMRRGESRMYWDFSTKFLKNKLTAAYKGDFRKQNLDPSRNYRFTSFSTSLNVAYRFRRNNRIAFQYREVSNDLSSSFTNSTTAGGNRMFQATGQFGTKLFKIPIQHILLIGHQEMNIPIINTSAYKSTSTQVSYQQLIPIKTYMLSTNLMYNHSSNKQNLFNTSFLNIESSISYSLMKKITASSGIGYYVNENWNKQLGIHQQLGISVFKNISFNLDISWRKAIVVHNPLLANYFFGSTSCMIKF
jgi:hypothetical protein